MNPRWHLLAELNSTSATRSENKMNFIFRMTFKIKKAMPFITKSKIKQNNFIFNGSNLCENLFKRIQYKVFFHSIAYMKKIS